MGGGGGVIFSLYDLSISYREASGNFKSMATFSLLIEIDLLWKVQIFLISHSPKVLEREWPFSRWGWWFFWGTANIWRIKRSFCNCHCCCWSWKWWWRFRKFIWFCYLSGFINSRSRNITFLFVTRITKVFVYVTCKIHK